MVHFVFVVEEGERSSSRGREGSVRSSSAARRLHWRSTKQGGSDAELAEEWCRRLKRWEFGEDAVDFCGGGIGAP